MIASLTANHSEGPLANFLMISTWIFYFSRISERVNQNRNGHVRSHTLRTLVTLHVFTNFPSTLIS